MKVAIVSSSKDPAITTPVLQRIAAACEDQLAFDYAPLWQAEPATVRVYSSVDMLPNDGQTMSLLVVDELDDEALGWHSVQSSGRPFGKIFWGELKRYGATLLAGASSLSCTISHEIIEAVTNPYVDLWVDITYGGTQEAYEACDRVEGDAYDREGVFVSNFLGPRAFRDGDGPYDFMGLLSHPWELRPGGYAIRRTNSVSHNVWGHGYPDAKKAIKERTLRNLRAHGRSRHEAV